MIKAISTSKQLQSLQKSEKSHHSIQSINTPSNPSSTPLITPILRSASGQGERPGGSPGSRTLRGVAH